MKLPTTFKEALSTQPTVYSQYWLTLKGTPAIALLTASQQEVLGDFLAVLTFFCNDTLETRRLWPSFRTLLFETAQGGGEHGVSGEQILKIL